MIERIIENWLDNSTERSFQIPFCYALQKKGHRIIHLTRHCAMELGKDIISIDAQGVVHVYQLKTAVNGSIKLANWTNEIHGQVLNLIHGAVDHPSIDKNKSHKSYLVTNGYLQEEVSRAICDLNRGLEQQGQSDKSLQTIVKGDLLEDFTQLGSGFWPKEFSDVKTLLELFLNEGKGPLPKKLLSNLFYNMLKLDRGKANQKEMERAVSSMAVICSIAISKFSECKNHVAEIQAWTMFFAYVCAAVEKYFLPLNNFKANLDLAQKAILNALGRLCDELIERENLWEGMPLYDIPFIPVRKTQLLAWLGIYGIWLKFFDQDNQKHSQFIRDFFKSEINSLLICGEYGIPQILTIYWFLRNIDATITPDSLLYNHLNLLVIFNQPTRTKGLPNPYYDESDAVPYFYEFEDNPIKETFSGYSYALESLTHLFVRRNWKQAMIPLWQDVTRIRFNSFHPAEKWMFYLWRSDKGTLKEIEPKHTKNWPELRTEAQSLSKEFLPDFFSEDLLFMLSFLITYPHRIRPDFVKLIDNKLWSLIWGSKDDENNK